MSTSEESTTQPPRASLEVSVRRLHRRDLNRTWDFIKRVFRDVNQETVEYQRPRTKRRFLEVYEEQGSEQLLFEANKEIVGYAECAFESAGDDSWVNPRYFEKREMRPLFVEELAVHPGYQGKGVGSFMLDQLQHLARVRGCTHLVLEVAENNEAALAWYRKRNFQKLDAAIFMAQKVEAEPELLPPRRIRWKKKEAAGEEAVAAEKAPKPAKPARPRAPRRKKAPPPERPAPEPAIEVAAPESPVLNGDGTTGTTAPSDESHAIHAAADPANDGPARL
jgi:ribosomal protein S18 acetylase RimI-like enzyme